MPGRHLIEVEPAGLLRITMGGFFLPEEVEAMAVALREANGRLRCPPHSHVTLVDVTDCALQPQAVIERFRDMLRQASHSSRRTAFVTGSSLIRMQIRRVMDTRPGLAMFDTREAAEAWLSEPVSRAA